MGYVFFLVKLLKIGRIPSFCDWSILRVFCVF